MVRALRAGSYLVAILLGVSLLLVLVGLAMAARPEFFGGLGLVTTAKTGMVVALAAGFTAIASAVLGWILDLLRGTLNDH